MIVTSDPVQVIPKIIKATAWREQITFDEIICDVHFVLQLGLIFILLAH